jgi:hypothetical protein
MRSKDNRMSDGIIKIYARQVNGSKGKISLIVTAVVLHDMVMRHFREGFSDFGKVKFVDAVLPPSVVTSRLDCGTDKVQLAARH